MKQQERSGWCHRCERQILISRQQAFLSWTEWHCTACGLRAQPIREGPAYERSASANFWIVVALLGTFVAIYLTALIVVSVR